MSTLAATRHPARPTKRFLVIEDDPASRDAFCALLQLTGNEAVGVENGEDALSFLDTHPAPTAILLDVRLPVMDGWQFRREQRSDPRLRDVPVLVVSGDVHARDQALASGAAGFIAKPIDPDELMGAIASLP
ncbi:MAG TPA: response regulator [Thermoanaerobaculia bacterium]|nr:response regulator [Thermoanaerobaculia bacterium]